MKYLVSALCVMYLPVHAFAESLQDNTNAALPNIPEVTNSAFQTSGSDKDLLIIYQLTIHLKQADSESVPILFL